MAKWLWRFGLVPYFSITCVVADIVDEVLLGEDLLLCDSSGSANIIQSEEIMMFREATIPLKMARLSIVRHVTAAEILRCNPWKRS